MACQYGRLISYAGSHRPLLIVFCLCVSIFSDWDHHRSFCLLFDMVPSVFGEPLFSITELSWLVFLYPSWVKPLAGSGQSVLTLRELHHFTLWYIGHCLLAPVLFNLSIWCVCAHACGNLALTLAVPLSCLRGWVPSEPCLLTVVSWLVQDPRPCWFSAGFAGGHNVCPAFTCFLGIRTRKVDNTD